MPRATIPPRLQEQVELQRTTIAKVQADLAQQTVLAAEVEIAGELAALSAEVDGKQPAGSYANLSHTHAIASVVGLQGALDAIAEFASPSFESVSKNLAGENAVLNYAGDDLTSVDYASGVTKTLNYSGGNLTSIVLSGTTPGGIDLTKTLSYTGSDLTGIAYS